jgi:hypothetical protein
MLRVRELIEWLTPRLDEEVYIDGDDLHCWSDDFIHIGDNEDEEDE